MESQGKKEVIEAVVTAALVALITGFIEYAFDLIHDRREKSQEKRNNETEKRE